MAISTSPTASVTACTRSARFRRPTGLHLVGNILYVADTGNHVTRAIDLTNGVATATVTTIAGVPATIGFGGDGGMPRSALLNSPHAVTRCPNGDLMIADTGNHRVRRIAATGGAITTIVGFGDVASASDGKPATSFPVSSPRGVACDAIGDLFITSTTTVRLLPAAPSGVVDGSGEVQTIYGKPPRTTFPSSATRGLTDITAVGATKVHVLDACSGLLVELERGPI